MIYSPQVEFKFRDFPTGERLLRVEEIKPNTKYVDVMWQFAEESETFLMLQLVDALKRMGYRMGDLELPYIPYSRQDRVCQSGESLSLAVFCNLVNSMEFRTVHVTDPHSDVSVALLKNVRVISQDEVFGHIIGDVAGEKFWLVSPDAGAMKKIWKLHEKFTGSSQGVIECSKRRDLKTGHITGTTVHAQDLHGYDAFIVDDICDGGATFIEIAKRLREIPRCGRIFLCVTHGFFTRGTGVLYGEAMVTVQKDGTSVRQQVKLMDGIFTRKGRVV